jgi:hypothetical protein
MKSSVWGEDDDDTIRQDDVKAGQEKEEIIDNVIKEMEDFWELE